MTPISNHAVDRWLLRFPGEDLDGAGERGVKVPFSRLTAWCQSNGMKPNFRTGSEYRYDAVTEAMFVVIPVKTDSLIVTVFRFRKNVNKGK